MLSPPMVLYGCPSMYCSLFFVVHPAHAASEVSHKIKCFQDPTQPYLEVRYFHHSFVQGLTAAGPYRMPLLSHHCQEFPLVLPLKTPPLAVSSSPFFVWLLKERSTSFRVRRGFLAS